MPNIFVSYAREDAEDFARKVVRSLEKVGADVFFDKDDIPAGISWSDSIQQGLDSSDVMLVIISPSSMTSPNVSDEWKYFQAHTKTIIPILYKPAKVHFQLQPLQYIDFYKMEYDKALVRLIRALNGEGLKLEYPRGYDVTSFPDTVPERPDSLGKSQPSKLNMPVIVIGVVVVLALIAGGVWFAFFSDTTPEVIGTNTPTFTANEAAAATFGAIQTQSSNDRQATRAQGAIETALANQIATGTSSASETQAANATSTQDSMVTIEADASATVVEATSVAISASQTLVTESVPSATPTLTATATAEPTQPIGFGDRQVTANEQWEVIREEINDVDMVLVPAGCFEPGIDGRNEVCFEDPYWIDRTEVSNNQFGLSGRNTTSGAPAEFVTWIEANTYCEARGARLPDANEWEYAARGPDNLLYPWGNEFFDAYVVYNQNATSTAVVDSYYRGASWVGALHMSGNVWEWVQGGTPTERPNRGGSFDWFGGTTDSVNDNLLTTASRPSDGTKRWYNIGFRCVRDYDPPTE